MIAIEVPEAYFGILSAERCVNALRGEIAYVRLDGCVALAREPVPRAVRMKEIEHAVVGPVECVDAERALARCESESDRDEEAALERADLGDMPLDAKLALAADDVAADRCREARRHAAHGV